MKSNFLVLALVFLSPALLHAQSSLPDAEWMRLMGGIYGDSPDFKALTLDDHQVIQAKVFPKISAELRKLYFFKLMLKDSGIFFQGFADLKHSKADWESGLKVSCQNAGAGEFTIRTAELSPTGNSSPASVQQIAIDNTLFEIPGFWEALFDGSLDKRSAKVSLIDHLTKGADAFNQKNFRAASIELTSFKRGCIEVFGPSAQSQYAELKDDYKVPEWQLAVAREARPSAQDAR